MPKIQQTISWGNLIGLIPLVFVVGLWLSDRHQDGKVLKETAGTVSAQGDLLTSHAARITSLEKSSEDRQRDLVRRLERIEDKLDRVQLR